MSHATSPVFAVKVANLCSHMEWNSAFGAGMKYFQMGAVYNGVPADYYATFDPVFFNDLIFFGNTTMTAGVQ